MRTITGLFQSYDAAKAASDALEDAGVLAHAITIDVPDDGDTVLSARVENETADAAHAIMSQAGAGSVDEVENDAELADGDVEGEEAARLREPVPPVIVPFSR